jgi:hypothetical protein
MSRVSARRASIGGKFRAMERLETVPAITERVQQAEGRWTDFSTRRQA